MPTRGIKGDLYLVSLVRWNSGLAFIEPMYLTARVKATPGWLICRPTWTDGESRRKWMETVQPTEVNAEDLNPEVRERVAACELMW
jgi:hypothetical protein